jgi:phosphoglycerol geranylgeranyltransferase
MIQVGGSIGAQGELLDITTKMIKEEVNVPVNIFPGNTSTVTHHADSIYFMRMLNSNNTYWHTTAQTVSANVVREMKLEVLPTGYVVVAPGGTVGWVGSANLIPRDKPSIAAAVALGGEYNGCRIIITDVGSASKEGPVPVPIVKAVAKTISVPYIVAGGIRTPKQAEDIIKAGADAIHVGTVIESGDVKKTTSAMVKAIKKAGKGRR